jgi:hypothetical protein
MQLAKILSVPKRCHKTDQKRMEMNNCDHLHTA